MSFVVTVSTSSVLFTPPNGAENAFAGQTIASETWNAINTDVANNGLAVVGKSAANTIKGNNTATANLVADLTPAQVNAILGQGTFSVAELVVSFSNASTDNQFNIALPTGFTNYRVEGLYLSKATGSLTAATVALYSAAGASGTTIVSQSTPVIVATSTAGANLNMQQFIINNQSTQSFATSTLFFRTGAATASAQGTVTLYVRALS